MKLIRTTIAMVAGVAALDALARRAFARNQPVIATVTINRTPLEVYAFYHTLEQLPQFMSYLESVEELADGCSRWTARLPLGGTVTWEAEVTEDRPGEVIAWRSKPGSQVQTSGRVTFTRAPGRDMTEIRVEMKLGGPGFRPTTSFARLFAKSQVKGDLRRLKQVMETGEVLFSDASVHRGLHPAQPSENSDLQPKIFIAQTPTAQKGAGR